MTTRGADAPAKTRPDEVCDVVVVGGGLSGVIVAEELAATSLSCTIIEAGPILERRLPSCNLPRYREVIKPLLDVDAQAWAYRPNGMPYEWLRVRAAGGRSLVWGGWLLWPHEQSFRDARRVGRPWPFELDDLATYLHRARRRLMPREAPMPPVFESAGKRLGLPVRPKLAGVGPCGCRPFVSLDWLRRALLKPNRVVTQVLTDRAGRATGVAYSDRETREPGVVLARTVVLAASPVETARLLLSHPDQNLMNPEGLVGRGLVDHLVASYLLLVPQPAPTQDLPTPIDRTAFVDRFVNVSRSTRRDYRGGFTMELHGPEPLSGLGDEGARTLGVDPKDVPSMSYYLVHAIGESQVHPQRRVRLDPDLHDSLGRRAPVIDLAWGEDEPRIARDMEEACIAVCDALASPGCRIVPVRETLKPGGIGHEAGGAAMGNRRSRSVTDMLGHVHGVRGLYVADASRFPTGLDRPPTLTLLGVALTTADAILEGA